MLCWVVLTAVLAPVAGGLSDRLGTAGIEAAGSESALGREQLASDFAGGHRYSVLVVAPRSTRSSCAVLADVVRRLTDSSVSPLPAAGPDDCYLDLGVDEDPNGLVESLREDRARLSAAAGGPVLVGGAPGISVDIGVTSEENVRRVEALALPLVFLLLLLVFRSLVAAAVPLVTAAVTVVVSTGLLGLLARQVELSPLTTSVVTMLGLGISIDYALFFTRRFRRELDQGASTADAAATTGRTTGRAVAWAGLTVAASLAALGLGGNVVTRSVALAGVVVVLVSLCISATLLPAVLRLLGPSLSRFALPVLRRGTKGATREESPGRVVRAVAAHPVAALVAGASVLGLLAVPAVRLDVHLPAGAWSELPWGTESRVATAEVVDALGEGTVFPLRLVVTATDGDVGAPGARRELGALVERAADLPGVASVRAPSLLGPAAPAGSVSTDGSATVVVVEPDVPAASAAARALVQDVRDVARGGQDLSVLVTGETANGVDVDAASARRTAWTLAVLALVTSVLLLGAFRSVVVPLKALAFTGAVTGATLGVVVAVFQLGWFSLVPPGPINTSTPVVMFALLFGLSTDYEVIMMGRIRELWDDGLGVPAAVRSAMASTNGMVNGAAAIMVVVFGAFLLSDFRVVQELGLGLAVAVALDVLVVRSVLLPAAVLLLGDRIFYPSRRRSRPHDPSDPHDPSVPQDPSVPDDGPVTDEETADEEETADDARPAGAGDPLGVGPRW